MQAVHACPIPSEEPVSSHVFQTPSKPAQYKRSEPLTSCYAQTQKSPAPLVLASHQLNNHPGGYAKPVRQYFLSARTNNHLCLQCTTYPIQPPLTKRSARSFLTRANSRASYEQFSGLQSLYVLHRNQISAIHRCWYRSIASHRRRVVHGYSSSGSPAMLQ